MPLSSLLLCDVSELIPLHKFSNSSLIFWSPHVPLQSQHFSICYLQLRALFRKHIYTFFICALSLSAITTIGSFREPTHTSGNASLLHILNRVYISLPSRSHWHQKSVKPMSLLPASPGCRVMVCLQNNYKWYSPGWPEPVLANRATLRRRWDLLTSRGAFHPKPNGLLGTVCQHATEDVILSHCGAC